MGTENTKKLPVGLRDKLPAWVYPSWASSGSAVAISTVMIGTNISIVRNSSEV